MVETSPRTEEFGYLLVMAASPAPPDPTTVSLDSGEVVLIPKCPAEVNLIFSFPPVWKI